MSIFWHSTATTKSRWRRCTVWHILSGLGLFPSALYGGTQPYIAWARLGITAHRDFDPTPLLRCRWMLRRLWDLGECGSACPHRLAHLRGYSRGTPPARDRLRRATAPRCST